MPISPEDIQPAAPAPTPAPAPAPGAEDELSKLLSEDGEVPEEVLRIPAFNALLEGRPPAVFIEQGKAPPEIQTINKYAPDLIRAGFGFYKADSMPVNVMFNGLLISPEELAKADQEGRLADIAAPYLEVKALYDGASLKGASATTPEATAAAPAAPAQPNVAPMPASAQRQLAKARTDVIEPGSPTSGPSPGQGRILNALKKPAV